MNTKRTAEEPNTPQTAEELSKSDRIRQDLKESRARLNLATVEWWALVLLVVGVGLIAWAGAGWWIGAIDWLHHVIRDVGLAVFTAGTLSVFYEYGVRKNFLSHVKDNLLISAEIAKR